MGFFNRFGISNDVVIFDISWIYAHNSQMSGIDSDDIRGIDDGEQGRGSIDLGILRGFFFNVFLLNTSFYEASGTGLAFAGWQPYASRRACTYIKPTFVG